MHLEPDDLIAQFQQDFPTEFQLASLRVLVRLQDERIQELQASQDASAFRPSPTPRVYGGSGSEGGHHAG